MDMNKFIRESMSDEQKVDFDKMLVKFKRNRYTARPLVRFLSPGWFVWKYMWVKREIELWWRSGEDVI
jgi:hypothetical protein